MPGSDDSRQGWFDFSAHFSAGVCAVLSQRNGTFPQTSLDDQRQTLALELGLSGDQIAVPHQVHGRQIAEGQGGNIHPETDGLLTADPAVALTLQVADCVPIYLYHPGSMTRALVHAGWRGAAAGIATEAVKKLVQAGATPGELEVVLGPSIEQDCYEVGAEVWGEFDPELSRANGLGGYQLDLAGAIHRDLQAAGVAASKIYSVEICTSCDERGHSYRRDGRQAGRMIAFFYQSGAGA